MYNHFVTNQLRRKPTPSTNIQTLYICIFEGHKRLQINFSVLESRVFLERAGKPIL